MSERKMTPHRSRAEVKRKSKQQLKHVLDNYLNLDKFEDIQVYCQQQEIKSVIDLLSVVKLNNWGGI